MTAPIVITDAQIEKIATDIQAQFSADSVDEARDYDLMLCRAAIEAYRAALAAGGAGAPAEPVRVGRIEIRAGRTAFFAFEQFDGLPDGDYWLYPFAETPAAQGAQTTAPVMTAYAGPMSRKQIDAIVYECRQKGTDTTYDIVNAALAATSAAPPPAVKESLTVATPTTAPVVIQQLTGDPKC